MSTLLINPSLRLAQFRLQPATGKQQLAAAYQPPSPTLLRKKKPTTSSAPPTWNLTTDTTQPVPWATRV